MKTLIKSLAFVLSFSVVSAATSFADNVPAKAATYETSMYTSVSGKLCISVDKQQGSTIDIRLKNIDGKVLYAEHLGKKESKFRSKMDLSQLPDGDYQVEITNGVDTKTHTITLSTQKPTVPSRLVALN